MTGRSIRAVICGSVASLTLAAPAGAQETQPNPVEAAAMQWLAAINAGDNEAGRAGFADDAVVVGPAGPIAVGRKEVDASVAYLTGTPGFHVDFTPERSGLSDDGMTGFVVGNSVIYVPGPDGSRVPQRQRLLLVWRKEKSGKWKCIYNVPMGAAPAAVTPNRPKSAPAN